jgi:hypothetical protein
VLNLELLLLEFRQQLLQLELRQQLLQQELEVEQEVELLLLE